MKLRRSIGFYILSVYLVSESTSFILKKFKLCKPCNHPRRPNSPTHSGPSTSTPLDHPVVTNAASPAPCFPGNDAQKWTILDLDKINKKMNDARRDFAFDALREASLINPNHNLFFSPHSINQAITLAYFGARGTTESSLKKALHIPEEFSKAHVQRFYDHEKTLHQRRKEQGKEPAGYEYNSANRLWISKEKNVRKCMLDLFSNELEKTDFRADPTAARNRINEWVSNTTKGHIKDLIPKGGVTDDTDLVLANAVYFKGLWASSFNEADSVRNHFYGPEVKTVTYMQQTGNFSYGWSERFNASILELPYKNDDVSMFILLPASEDGDQQRSGIKVDDLINEITITEDKVRKLTSFLFNKMYASMITVILPRFKIDYELQVVPLLRALGANDLVTPGVADLGDFLADGEGNLHLGDAVHRANIDVNEEGTTAAAATAVVDSRSNSGYPVFYADHPFLYMIYDKVNDIILFIGKYVTPPSEPTNP